MRPIAVAALLVSWLAGCNAILGVDEDYTVGELGGAGATATGTGSGTGTGGGTSTGSGTGIGGGTGTGTGVGGGTPSGTGSEGLTDRGLIARYYIDEAASGSNAVSDLIDSAPAPLDLPLTWASAMSYTEVGGNRGLTWSTAQSGGLAETTLNGTKIATELDGSGTVTIEVVADVQSAGSHPAFTVYLGPTGGTGLEQLGLRMPPTAEYRLRWMEVGSGQWARTAGRKVVHLVLDTAQAVAADRNKLFADGTLQTDTGQPPSANDTLSFLAGSSFCLGNRSGGTRSIEGTLFYAALYAEALTPAEVLHNAQILLADDDAP